MIRMIRRRRCVVHVDMNRAKTGLLTVGAVLLGALPLSAAASGAAGRNHAVALKKLSITPGVLRIHRGDSVTWTWGDKNIESPHNVTPTGRLRFRGAHTRLTGTYTVRFTKPGVYSYHCTIHPFSMHAQIIVR